MSRAVPVDPSFDPVPSVGRLAALQVSAAGSVPADADLVGIVVAEGAAVDGVDDAHLAAAGFRGATGQVLVVPGAVPLALVGVGAAPLTADAARDAAAAAVGAVASAVRPALVVGDGHGLDAAVVAAAVTEGAVLARYDYGVLRREQRATPLEALTVVGTAVDGLAAGAQRGRVLAAATSIARDLANTPPAHLTAVTWAQVAQRLAPTRQLGVEVFDRDQLLELRCGGIIAVNGGSADEPRMITLRFEPAGATADTPHVVLVGKGLTYDSGGIAIKPGDDVHAQMKNDMSGGGAVFAAMCVLAEAGCPVRVTAHLMCTDNMPSGTALKMGDVITHRDGTTVEVVNTDAEGRLVMADALVLGHEAAPTAMLDVATLTGAAMRALGTEIAAVMGTDQALVDRVRAAGDRTGEPAWPLPMGARYKAELASDVADMKNLGGPLAGASAAAEFLAVFAHGTPWAHIDIAGCATVARPGGWRPRGMSGFGARLLVDLLCEFGS